VSSSEPVLRVDGLTACWGGRPVVDRVSFAVAEGELLALMGPNGSGKTTLLRCLAGLERPEAGSIRLEGREVRDVPAHRRGIGLMLQDPALFPHRTVYENIAYAPLLQRRPGGEIDAEVGRLVALLGLAGFEDRYPDALSGGERQRVALARSLAARPRVLLLDEPFASIDVELKAELRSAFKSVLGALHVTAVHVTHDREEGLFLGDRVGLLFDGRLTAPDAPATVFGRPPDARAARFLGYNVLAVDGRTVAVRPEATRFARAGDASRPGTVRAAGSTGPGALAVVALATGDRVELRLPPTAAIPAVGTPVEVAWDPADALPVAEAGPKSPKADAR